jgi:choline dehydrogenase-like flavoprotein
VAAGWSERQLGALAATFVAIRGPDRYDGEARRHAELCASALDDVGEPSDVRRLKLLLTIFGNRIADERGLERWATSRFGTRRTFFQTVKRLASFFAYADRGPRGVNPRWSDIGYEPAHNDAAAPSESIARALVPVDDGTVELALETDVVVVGTGAGGGLIAARLAEAGRAVLVMEAGPYVPEPDMPTNELDAFDRLYLDHGMTSTKDVGVSILSGAAVGGGTLVNWTTTIEPPADIRSAWATDYGLTGFDASETDADLARLRGELGFESPPSIGAKDQAILDGCRSLGWEAAPTQRNAIDCADCGSCAFGCRRGAKLSGPRGHLADAAANGARLLPNARVLSASIEGGRATGVTGTLASGRRFRVRARAVVLAAGALRTPIVLLRSDLRNDRVGRNLRLHPTVVVAARMPGPVAMWRDTMQAARSLQFREEGIVIESAPGHPGLIALAFPWPGAAQQEALMRESAAYVPFIGICRDTDGGRVRITTSGRASITYRISERDIATARSALVKLATLARAAGAQRMLAFSTSARWHDVDANGGPAWDAYLAGLANLDFTPNRATMFSAHQMGTARAGANPATSATDPLGRVWRDTRGALVKGLYVGDASLFPTSIGVNPMITVMALAARVARAIEADT